MSYISLNLSFLISAVKKAGNTLTRDFNEIEKLQTSLRGHADFTKAAEERMNKILRIELQKGKIDDDHIQRCLLYSKWVNETLAIGSNIVQPILICFESYDFIHGEKHRIKRQSQERLENVIKD